MTITTTKKINWGDKMAVVSRMVLTNVFADDSTEQISIDNLRSENINIANVKNTIKNFNRNSGGELSTKMKSKNGFNWIGIKRAQIVTTDTNVIF